MAKITTRTKYIEQILKSEVFKVGEGLVGTAALTGKGILIENALDDPRIIKHEDPALEVRSVIVVPIRFREKNLGALAIVNPSDGGSFGETDFSLAASLAEQAGLAIHNLDLMAQQLERSRLDTDLGLAREIQRMLLPKQFPDNPLLQMGSIYKPAQKVGGDLYDFFTIDENRVGVAIADVSGKGIPASLLMAICQSNLRHFARDFESPAVVLCELNDVLLGEMRQDMFITLVYAVIYLDTGKLVFARGGHELPIMLRLDEDTKKVQSEFLGSEGMALGMVPNQIFAPAIEDRTVNFGKGDVFALYTDGVTEAVNKDAVEFGNARLSEVLRTLRSSDAEEIANGVLDRIDLYSGDSGQADDFTVVIVKHL